MDRYDAQEYLKLLLILGGLFAVFEGGAALLLWVFGSVGTLLILFGIFSAGIVYLCLVAVFGK